MLIMDSGQSSKIDMSRCETAQFHQGEIMCKAGLNSKALPMTTKRCGADKGHRIFARMMVGECWLCKAVTGCTASSHTSIGRTTLIKDLLKLVVRAADDYVPTNEADDNDNGADPMDDIDVEAAPIEENGRGRKRSRGQLKKSNVAKGKLLTFEMSATCPEFDPNSTEKRNVTLLIQDRKTVWLLLEDVDWAIKYMYAQNMLKGVASVSPEDEGPQAQSP